MSKLIFTSACGDIYKKDRDLKSVYLIFLRKDVDIVKKLTCRGLIELTYTYSHKKIKNYFVFYIHSNNDKNPIKII